MGLSHCCHSTIGANAPVFEWFYETRLIVVKWLYEDHPAPEVCKGAVDGSGRDTERAELYDEAQKFIFFAV